MGITTFFLRPLTVPLNSPNGRQMPAIRAVQGDCERVKMEHSSANHTFDLLSQTALLLITQPTAHMSSLTGGAILWLNSFLLGHQIIMLSEYSLWWTFDLWKLLIFCHAWILRASKPMVHIDGLNHLGLKLFCRSPPGPRREIEGFATHIYITREMRAIFHDAYMWHQAKMINARQQ